MSVYSVFVSGSGLVTGRVLLNVLDQETEVKRNVSWMPHAPSGSNGNKPSNHIKILTRKAKIFRTKNG
jgi:hypothetical protein